MNTKERMDYYKLGNIFSDSAHMEYLFRHRPKYLYQYRAGNQRNYKNLLKQKNWLSLPLYLNDPFEQEYGIYSDGVLISCFTENYNSLLMWSHYTDGHKGYCLKYSFDELFNYYNLNLYPVIYSSQRFKPLIMKSGNTNEIINTFLHKAPEWKYEKEWRIINLVPIDRNKLKNVNINKGEEVFIPKPIEIILGSHFWDYENKQKIVKFCSKNNIILSRMYLKDYKYKLFKKVLPLSLFIPSDDNSEEFMRKQYKSEEELEKFLENMEREQNEIEEQRYTKMKDFL